MMLPWKIVLAGNVPDAPRARLVMVLPIYSYLLYLLSSNSMVRSRDSTGTGGRDHDAAAATLLEIDDFAPHRSFIATHSHLIQPSDHLFPVSLI